MASTAEPEEFVNDGFNVFTTIMLLLTGTVFIRAINYHFIRISPSVMVAVSALLWSGVLILLQFANDNISKALDALRAGLQTFPEVVMDYMLGYLLFAAAIEVDLSRLRRVRSTVFSLAFGGTIYSTLIIGVLTWLLLRRLSPMPLAICLLFGSVVSPTDPIAVTSVLNEKPELISDSTRYFVWCESLFNDAVGLVLYYGLTNFVKRADESFSIKLWSMFQLLISACGVGIIMGLFMGYLAYLLIQATDDPVLEITITFVLVGMIEVVCVYIDASIPLASICAGLMIGNYGTNFGFSERGKEGFHQLWMLIDETLNSLLFLLVGLMSVYWKPNILGWGKYIILMVTFIPISLFGRAASIALALANVIGLERLFGKPMRHPSIRYRAGTVAVLTWGGLRGGLTIALALGVIRNTTPKNSANGNIIFLMTYTIVVWSLIQGLLFEKACHMIQDASYRLNRFRLEMEEQADIRMAASKSQSERLVAGIAHNTILYSEESAERNDPQMREQLSSMSNLEKLRPLPHIQDMMRAFFSRGEEEE